jgi:ribosome-associated translation inhibitor RaiA
MTQTVNTMGKNQTNQNELLHQKIAKTETFLTEKSTSVYASMNEKIDKITNDVNIYSNDTSVKLRASLERQSLLRESVDDALTALATELRASLSMTGAVEKKCESIASTMSDTDSENTMRFEVINQAIQALAAVVDDS